MYNVHFIHYSQYNADDLVLSVHDIVMIIRPVML